METDNEVELGEKLRPSCLAAGQELHCGEILQILVVSDNIHRSGRAFQIVTPGAESLVDGEELLIMGIIVEFWHCQRPRAECDQMDLTILTMDGDDTRNGVVRGVSLHNNGMIWQPMSQDGGGSEGVFEASESNATVIRK